MGAGQNSGADIRQYHLEQNCWPVCALALRRLGQRAHINGPQTSIDRAVHVGHREADISEGQQDIRAERAAR